MSSRPRRTILIYRVDVSFSFRPAGFANHLSETFRNLAASAFKAEAPHILYHYTKPERVQSIIQSRALWATCLGDQERDHSELHCAIGWVEEAIRRKLTEGISQFSSLVLPLVGQAMEARRRWMFITCFCANDSSEFHWREYGAYKLCLPLSYLSRLRSDDWKAEAWYQNVIYDQGLQRRVMSHAIEIMPLLIDRYSVGLPEGPFVTQYAESCARDAALCLLGIAAGFKSEEYADDQEWRLVCAPHAALTASAPSIGDEDFQHCIIEEPKRHVCLHMQPKYGRSNSLSPELPFASFLQSPLHQNESEFVSIQELLSSRGYRDMEGCE